MENSAVYRKTYQVGMSDIDFAGRLRLSSLFDYLQDAASESAAELGAGMTRLDEIGLAWVVLRMRVDVIRYPAWEEMVTVETWPLPPGRFEFERDYLVWDAEGQIIARAISTWAVIDVAKRRLCRSDLVPRRAHPAEKERAMDHKLRKLQAPAELTPVYQRTIGYSDIDVNGHLNNCKYVDFVMDCYSVEEHRQYQATSIEINFVNEALPGETILMRREATPNRGNSLYIEGTNDDTQQVVFRAQLQISPRTTE
jgi:medium-chain acyl-[acyl-carrier-protein] hydrolase